MIPALRPAARGAGRPHRRPRPDRRRLLLHSRHGAGLRRRVVRGQRRAHGPSRPPRAGEAHRGQRHRHQAQRARDHGRHRPGERRPARLGQGDARGPAAEGRDHPRHLRQRRQREGGDGGLDRLPPDREGGRALGDRERALGAEAGERRDEARSLARRPAALGACIAAVAAGAPPATLPAAAAAPPRSSRLAVAAARRRGQAEVHPRLHRLPPVRREDRPARRARLAPRPSGSRRSPGCWATPARPRRLPGDRGRSRCEGYRGVAGEEPARGRSRGHRGPGLAAGRTCGST